MSLKYKIKRFRVWMKGKFNTPSSSEPGVSTVQEKALTIVKKLIAHEDSELHLAPISEKSYIRNVEKDLYVIIQRGNISIINGKYHYDVYISDKKFDDLKGIIDHRVERDRSKMEKEIRARVEKSLDQILSDHFPPFEGI